MVSELLLACTELHSRATTSLLAQLFYVIKSLIKCIIQQCSSTQHQYLFGFFKISVDKMRQAHFCIKPVEYNGDLLVYFGII